MARKRTKTFNMSDLTIGSKVYIVHNTYAFQSKVGGKVSLARIVSFVNKSGKIEPEFRLVGQPTVSSNLSMEHYHVFTDIKKALNAIKS